MGVEAAAAAETEEATAVAATPATPAMVPEMGVDPATKGPDHRTFRQESGGGVACTSGGASQLSFVRSRRPVLGRT